MNTIEVLHLGKVGGPPTGGRRKSRHPALPWVILIVGLLSLEVGLCAWGIYCATQTGQAMVEADYYNKALHWDDHLAMQNASRKLGWKTALSVGTTSTTNGQRALMLEVRDAHGELLRDASVEVAYFHHAHPYDLRKTPMAVTGDGIYAASIPLEYRGTWEFRITAKRGTATYIEAIERDVGK